MSAQEEQQDIRATTQEGPQKQPKADSESLLDLVTKAQGSMSIYGSLSELLRDEKVSANTKMGLFHSMYLRTPGSFNQFIVPLQLSHCDIERDRSHRIKSIKLKKQKLVGEALGAVLCVAALSQEGYSHAIRQKNDDGCYEILAIKKWIGVDRYETKVKRSGVEEIATYTRVFDCSSMINVYVSLEMLENVMTAECITLSSVRGILTALNRWGKSASAAELEAEELTLANTVSVCQEEATKSADKSNFFSTLLKLHTASSSVEERLEILGDQPSFKLAHALGFLYPHSGQAVISLATKKGVKTQDLSSVDDATPILMGQYTIANNQWEKVSASHISKLMVVVEDEAGLGVRSSGKGRKVSKLEKAVYYSKRELLTLLNIIAKCNAARDEDKIGTTEQTSEEAPNAGMEEAADELEEIMLD